MSEIDYILKAMQHETRRMILELLETQELTHAELLPLCDNSTGKLNYHLRSLEGMIGKKETKYIITEKGRLVLHWIREIEISEKKSTKPTVHSHNEKIYPAKSLRNKYIVKNIFWLPIELVVFTIILVILYYSFIFLVFYLENKITISAQDILRYIPNQSLVIEFYLFIIFFWIIAKNIFVVFYVPSIVYEITDTEIIVQKGLITKSSKFVPFRTIVNLEVHRGYFDRRFGMGSILISTAGKPFPEETMEGLVEVEEVRELLLKQIRLLNPPELIEKRKNWALEKISQEFDTTIEILTHDSN